MTSPTDSKTAEHLMNLVVTRNGEVPNFSLLLGAGASVNSGVKTAEEMVSGWRGFLYEQADRPEDFQTWMRGQPWNRGDDDEYSLLFEAVFDQPAQRRVYVEECVKNAHPSLGYVYLADLLKNHFFDVVLTTNFDDLLNEACYLYSSGPRPIVAAHDSVIQNIRVASQRPTIVKLHGDFLYDNIKNTLSELETLEANTKKKLSQFAKEYGLIVLGYSGRDRSVMDNIELLLRDEENFPYGVYWCLRRGADRSNRLQNLLSKSRVYPVQIDGFDEFMADLHSMARLDPPDAIARPLDIARDRARIFLNSASPLRNHKVIGPHISMLIANTASFTIELPLAARAALLSANDEFDEAIHIWKQVYEDDPADAVVEYAYANALAGAGRNDELFNLISASTMGDHNKTYFLLRTGRDQEVVNVGSSFLARPGAFDVSKREELGIVLVNQAIAFKRLGDDALHGALALLETLGHADNPRVAVAIAALRGDKAAVLGALNDRPNELFSPREVRVFPLFEDYRDDPDFIKYTETADEDTITESVIPFLSHPIPPEEVE